ncbi:MAG TPA: Wzz/FepE/Etk N-terminal domain-containing protein [Gaiellaceae bacterium]|jgi:uncharacterized protein involved in exopolysaccharide biosynthesis
MATQTPPRTPERRLPELEDEREVDLGRYWRTIAAHWWLPVAGIVAGIAIGLLISIGGSQVYQAKATIYLGQPLSSSGVQVQSQATNPSTVRTIVTAPITIDAVANKVGLKPSQLRGHVSTQAVSGAITRLGQNPLVSITVTGHLRGKVAAAANALAIRVKTSPALARYSQVKIATLGEQVAAENKVVANIDASTREFQSKIQQSSLSTVEKLILQNQLNGLLQQRQQIVSQRASDKQQLALAQEVEAPRVITRAVATKTTARSRRNTIVVAALIGLILGLIAALVWEPLMRVVRRPA